jgi:MtN3 and saliva related transmembrane protein
METQRMFSEKFRNHLEGAMIAIGIIGPLATVPQIIKIWGTHSQHAVGQSLITWSLYSGMAMLWMGYGFINARPAIYVGNGIGIAMYGSVVAGILHHHGLTY